ncbi:MAG: hypothetical protein ACYTED_19685 [Planctomycetota bacterium]
MFVSPDGLAPEAGGARLLLLDMNLDALFAVGLARGEREVVSSVAVGAGPALAAPTSVTTDPFAARVFVTQRLPTQVMLLELDPVTGDRSALATGALGDGPVLVFPLGVIFDAARDRVVVLNRATP